MIDMASCGDLSGLVKESEYERQSLGTGDVKIQSPIELKRSIPELLNELFLASERDLRSLKLNLYCGHFHPVSDREQQVNGLLRLRVLERLREAFPREALVHQKMNRVGRAFIEREGNV